MKLPFSRVCLAIALATASLVLAAPPDKKIPPMSIHPPLPDGVLTRRDFQYVTNGDERQRLDLYWPEKNDGPFAVILWIHGGGWQNGDKNGGMPVRSGFVAGRGFAIASIGYRLSMQASYPAQLEDCKAAIRWLRAHAVELGIDPNRIGVWGPSAGGHLAALIGTTGDTREFDVGENLDQSSAVQAVCDYYGPTDFSLMDAHAGSYARFRHNDASSPESELIGAAIGDPANRSLVQRANPIAFVTKKDPPFLIVHGTEDDLVPHHQSEILHAALVKAGVTSHLITVEGGAHGAKLPTPTIYDRVSEFFHRHLDGNTRPTDPLWSRTVFPAPPPK